MPKAITIRPMGRKVKKPSGAKPCSSRVSLITRLGGVPIRVSMPPRLPAKATGMSRREERMPELAAMLMMMGIMMATVPVLLTKAPMNEVARTT